MRRSFSCTAALAAALALAGAPRAADEVQPGAYCPLPEPGEKPACLEPARGAYAGFFEAVEEGDPDDEAVAEVEAAVEQGESEQAYLALSSLAYGYYRLSQIAVASPGDDPAIVARLERWNALLARAYAGSDDPRYRGAVKTAVLDVGESSPALEVSCIDAEGERVACRSTEAVLRGVDRADGDVGVRGALERMLRRMNDDGGDS